MGRRPTGGPAVVPQPLVLHTGARDPVSGCHRAPRLPWRRQPLLARFMGVGSNATGREPRETRLHTRHSQSPTSGYTCCFIAAPPAHSWITSPGGHSHQSIHWALLSPKPVAVSQAASSLATSASASWLLLPWAVGRLACVHHRGMLGFGVLPAQSRPLFPYLAPGYSGSHPQSPSDLQSHMGGSPSDGPQSSVCPAQQMEAEWAVQNANLIAASLFLKMPPWLVQRQEPWCDSEALRSALARLGGVYASLLPLCALDTGHSSTPLTPSHPPHVPSRIWTAFSLLACSHPLDRSSSAASPEGPLAFSAVNSSATPL
nr:uncharacterized protein LOC105483986 isoform X2 [Macaca nemestrina]